MAPVAAPGDVALHTVGGVTLGRWPGLGAPGLDLAVTTRRGGVSRGPYHSLNLALHVGDDPGDVLENRRRAATAFGCTVDDLVFAQQVHGAGVATVDRRHRGRGGRRLDDALAGVDALVTTDPGVVLVLQVADCVPIALYDPGARALALVHAGWRGTVAGVGGAALDALADVGARPGRIVALLGPCVAPERYQVGSEVEEAVGAALAGSGLTGVAFDRAMGEVLAADGADHWRLDLAAANRLLLERRGVALQHLVTSAAPTGGAGPFFSDRQARPCGRFALLARLHPYDGTAPAAI
jgi:hypothetical protein